ncbi:uncharacterized protein BDZ99DRAFT_567104 [Mytilinidion resinicola]|uniref:1-phosphatidylinositol-3-phosphate 5-kinase n=1 Tax=Mytilinidion resinicola TaxID=574789 RepID=A0A6A6Z4L1_9PEZI|nr:uncharacterized protein BDZ99DRAFT_567104 [Mytilinidion resinicola]KAF2815224.1 hypothetical protein BDZ99DRAFT_567104 [Mytilinidion resinicola]
MNPKDPATRRSRRGSVSDPLAQIHSLASRTESLTTFGDFASPPSSSGADAKGIDLVQGGFSGLYSRLKASVGGARDGNEAPDDVSISSANMRTTKPSQTPKSPGTAVSSPVVVSVPSSRLQSPAVTSFPDVQLPPSRDSNNSGLAAASRGSSNGPKPALPTNKSRGSLVASIEPLKLYKDNDNGSQSPAGSIARSKNGRGLDSPQHPPSAGLGTPNTVEGARYVASGDEPFRQSRDDMDLRDDESDTTEDDLVMVDGGAFYESTKSQQNPNDTATGDSGLQRIVSRRDDDKIQPSTTLGNLPSKGADKSELADRVLDKLATDPAYKSFIAPQRPPMLQISQSHLPGYRHSRTSSSDGLSSIATIAPARSPRFPPVEEHPRARPPSSLSRNLPNNAFSQSRRKILPKEFWMRDENAKDCFYCGDAFSTFRRKHHCRTCGQIFDAKCTSLVSGKLFGQSGNLRVCKPCEALLYGDDDDSSVYTDEADRNSLYEQDETLGFMDDIDRNTDTTESDHTKIGTPTISIPMSRKAGGEKKRRSAVIELGAPPMLARPSSSRSLRSLSGRPRSSSHKRHLSRHQHMRHVRYDERAPFHRHDAEDLRNRPTLPAFHHDNIIDPDLAAFMSDEDSSDEEPASIFATLSADSPPHASGESERSGLGGLLAAMRKGKSRIGERSVVGNPRDTDTASIASRQMNRHSRRRNMSVSSTVGLRPSPRRSKSNSLLRSIGVGLGGSVGQPPAPNNQTLPLPIVGFQMTRSSSMQGGNAPVVELNQASLHHVRKLLKQMLYDSGIPNLARWEKALMPILLQCTDDVNPDVQHNDDIDIRHYIKLKKIPGGRPGDTSYVSGVVFTKKVALKSMPRSIAHPRILIVTFPIEYARHQQHFMSLEPVIAQEREYLRNLVDRIAALQPSVLLVQRNVAGLALEFLEEANIAVAYNVKPTVLNAVSRCTQTRMISSVEKLNIDPSHLGRCQSFDVKTYVHENRKKTFIYLSGCQSDLGCTIVLRGATVETLKALKKIAEFLCFVVYNLKLETCLMRDEFVLIPSTTMGGTILAGKKDHSRSNLEIADTSRDSGSAAPQNQTPQTTNEASDVNSHAIQTDTDDNVANAPISAKNSITSNSATALTVPDDAPLPSFYGEMVETHQTKILSASPFVKFMPPYLLMQAREQERKVGYLKNLRDRYTTDDEKTSTDDPEEFELVQPEMVHTVLEQTSKQVRDFLHAVHNAEFDKALHAYQTQKRQWEGYVSSNLNLFDPFNHQKIAVLYSVVNSVTSTPCVGPEIIALAFYHEHDYDDGFTPDCTLGQYVEDLCHGASTICDVNGCDKRMLDHHRQYVHGEGQMSVIVKKYPSKIRGLHNTILMWSVCRKCAIETQVIPMSENTWKYSFAKYLELTFWSTKLHPRADICPHDIHRDHVRYFGLNNVAIQIQYDNVHLYEVIVPRPTVTWKVDSDLRLKNEQFLKIEDRLDRFMTSVKTRLKSIHVESVIPEKIEACRAEVDKLTKRASEEHDWLRQKLQDKYMCSRYYEIIPLNRAIRAIQEKAISWDDAFAEFEHQFFPSEKDIRRLAALQLKKIFLERDESSSSLASVEEGNEALSSPELREKGETLSLNPMPSHMSPEHARDMLTSVVEEDQTSGSRLGEEQTSTAVRHGPSSRRNSSSINPEMLLQTPIEAFEREDVRHLDLAVSSNFRESTSSPKATQDVNPPTLSPESSISQEIAPTITSPSIKPEPLDDSISEAVDSMQQTELNSSSAGSIIESKIPRLVDAIRREGVLKPPAMTRTQSQPGGLSRRDQYGNGSTSSITTSIGTSKGDSQKMSLSESAKALERRMTERLGLGSFKASKSSSHSMIPRSVPRKRNESKVSTLAKHFEQLSREFEKERLRERRLRAERSRQARAYPLASSKPIVEVYHDVHDAVQEQSQSEEDPSTATPARLSTDNSTLEDSSFSGTTEPTTGTESPTDERNPKSSTSPSIESQEHGANTSHPTSDAEGDASDIENTILDDLRLPESIDESQLLSPTESQLDISLELPKHEKTSLMKMLTSFWSERSASGWAPLDYPFAQIEHVWEDSDIIVREDEPSSIIALALSSPDYLTKLHSFRTEQSKMENAMGQNGLADSEASIERNLLHQANTNIRYGFTNRGVKAQCKIFYAESFDALRRKCGVADRFVESLSRCSKWDSKGGKSKSLFLKTLDDRFVLKSLSPIEVNSFFRFAPNYFAFTHKNLFEGLPTVIAKMFGLFQVQIKTPTGRDFDWYMLVMENLFYDREPNRRFDLKGSMRNRKIQSTGERDEVLLDENLVDIIYSETPIFVREHTKKLLKACVWNDTLFLSQQNVMDYSLMAGFDDTHREIIVGIIDCIRTYTWDKKLESWIKDRGKNKPTITSPKDYRNRFRIAMAKYILQAPNCWHQFTEQSVQPRHIRSEAQAEQETVMDSNGDARAVIGHF